MILLVKSHDMKWTGGFYLEVKRLGLSVVVIGNRRFGAIKRKSKGEGYNYYQSFLLCHCKFQHPAFLLFNWINFVVSIEAPILSFGIFIKIHNSSIIAEFTNLSISPTPSILYYLRLPLLLDFSWYFPCLWLLTLFLLSESWLIEVL